MRVYVKVREGLPPGAELVSALQWYARGLIDQPRREGDRISFDLPPPPRGIIVRATKGATGTYRTFTLDDDRSRWVVENTRHGALTRALSAITEHWEGGRWPIAIPVLFAERLWRVGEEATRPLSGPVVRHRTLVRLPADDLAAFRGKYGHGQMTKLFAEALRVANRARGQGGAGRVTGLDVILKVRRQGGER